MIRTYVATRNYEKRITLGQRYKGYTDGGSMEFKDNFNQDTRISMNSVNDKTWFRLAPEVSKNTRII